MKKLFKFLKNLFKKEDLMEIKVDKENGVMEIVTDKYLTPEDIVKILREHL